MSESPQHILINWRDVEKYVDQKLVDRLQTAIMDVAVQVEAGRENDGKAPFNSYLVINQDEPYAAEVIEIMKRHGHWG